MEHPSFSKDAINASRAYCDLMAEVKRRIDALREMITREFFQHRPAIVALECCYLQLRMITEGIAQACLTAHGTSPGARSQWMRSRDSADEIMDRLSELHSDFYPIPERQNRDPQGRWIGGMLRTEGFIKRRELTRLYSTCGNQLHFGSFDKRRRRKPVNVDAHIRDLNKALAGIVGLLQWHTIVTVDPAIQLWVDMTPPDGNGVSVRLIRVENSSPEFLQQLSTSRSEVDRHG
jgi:hypothetical protein